MAEAGYDGTGDSYRARGFLRTGMGALVGAATFVGALGLEARLQPALGQDVARVAYQQTNLGQHGVPDVAGLKPYQTRFADLTDQIPGFETRADFYDVNGGNIGLFSIRGRVFSIAVDKDKRPPLDAAYIDKTGDGKFEAYDPRAKIEVPQWVLR
jgi:hypothetical protein